MPDPPNGLLPGRGPGAGRGAGVGRAAGDAAGVVVAPPVSGADWAAGACGAAGVPAAGAAGRAGVGRPGVGRADGVAVGPLGVTAAAPLSGAAGCVAGAAGAGADVGCSGAVADGVADAAGLGAGRLAGPAGVGLAAPPGLLSALGDSSLAGNASRSLRSTGASTVDDADFTYSPFAFSHATASLLGIPSSLASALTRTFDTSLLSSVRAGLVARQGVDRWFLGGLLIAASSSRAHGWSLLNRLRRSCRCRALLRSTRVGR